MGGSPSLRVVCWRDENSSLREDGLERDVKFETKFADNDSIVDISFSLNNRLNPSRLFELPAVNCCLN